MRRPPLISVNVASLGISCHTLSLIELYNIAVSSSHLTVDTGEC